MRIRTVLITLVAIASLTSQAYSQDDSGCGEALVIATYNRAQIEHDDWRLASYVTESEYNTIKKDAGASAVIYGVPVGASYSDYQRRVIEKTNSYQESLTHDQAINVMWTGLDPNAANAYSECLKAKIFNQPGLHFAVRAATKDQVSVVMVWTPIGDESRNAIPEWTWKGESFSSLPRSVPSGMRIAILPRPKEQQMLAANYKGHADSLVIDPYPPPPTPALVHSEETSEEYRSPEIVGWGSNWSAPFALCTPDKPADWTIVKVYDFHLESATERSTCGAFTTCGGSNTDTATHVCRVVSVQGHNENRFDGYGRAVAVFHVTWRHLVKNQP
jgi:hypothetical protein